jgi:cytochrome P450
VGILAKGCWQRFHPPAEMQLQPLQLTIHRSFFHILQFGMGPRSCQGKNIALMVLSKVILQLVRTYEFELDEQLKGKEWKTLNYWIVKQQDFKCQLALRGPSKQ